MLCIFVTEDVSNNGRVSIDVPCNIACIFVTEDVSNSGRLLSLLQSLNMFDIFVTEDVSNNGTD